MNALRSLTAIIYIYIYISARGFCKKILLYAKRGRFRAPVVSSYEVFTLCRKSGFLVRLVANDVACGDSEPDGHATEEAAEVYKGKHTETSYRINQIECYYAVAHKHGIPVSGDKFVSDFCSKKEVTDGLTIVANNNAKIKVCFAFAKASDLPDEGYVIQDFSNIHLFAEYTFDFTNVPAFDPVTQ